MDNTALIKKLKSNFSLAQLLSFSKNREEIVAAGIVNQNGIMGMQVCPPHKGSVQGQQGQDMDMGMGNLI